MAIQETTGNWISDKGGERQLRASHGQAYMIGTRFMRHRLAVFGLVMVTLLILSAIFASRLAPHDPTVFQIKNRFIPPLHKGFILGTDELGRDMLSRLLYAGQISLVVGLAAMAVTLLIGSF